MRITKNDKLYNVDIEQIEFNHEFFNDISSKIKICENNNDGLLSVQFSTAYSRIFNIIEILRKNNFTKEEIIEKLELIKAEFIYIENISYYKYKEIFFSYLKDDSNLHLIDNLKECVEHLLFMFKNVNVDK